MTIFSINHFEWLASQKKDIGFLDFRAVTLAELPHFQVYSEWVEAENHQPLDYLKRNKDLRKNPALLEPGVKTGVVFLFPYPKELQSNHLSKYAQGQDYHLKLRDALTTLSEKFKQRWGPMPAERICIDTAPLLERALAEQSGLGWIGKNGCLISRKHGSFTLIACWLVSLEYPIPAKPHSFHCGKCTLCLEHCPTNAFIKPGLLDVEKCLSTQTIENRGRIEVQYHDAMGRNAFGCDVCMDVCPWNKKHLPEIHEQLPPLHQLLQMKEHEFRSFFRKTPLERPGWAGLRRNFLIAASNDSRTPEDIFLKHLEHEHPMIRETAQQIMTRRTQAVPSA